MPCLLLLVIIQVLLMRIYPRLGLMHALITAYAICLVGLIAINLFYWYAAGSNTDIISVFIANFLIFSCCSYCYTDFLMLGESSLRFRIIHEIRLSETGVTKREIIEKYDEKVILEFRLKRLINNGYLAERDGRVWLIKPNILWLTRIIDLARKLILPPSASGRY